MTHRPPDETSSTGSDQLSARAKGCRIVPVLAGGGARLSAHIGVLAALEELQLQFNHIVGVSGGSIIGALYASGYHLAKIEQIATDTDFSQFLDQSLMSLLRSGGLSTGDRFESWMDEKLKGIRFEDLPGNFHVVATDVHTGMPVIFNRSNSPHLPISRAVRFSMSIPILFSFKPFRTHLLVDGSILAEEALQRDWSGEGDPVLCFRLRSAHPPTPRQRTPAIPLKHYLTLLVRTFMTTMSREYINDSFWHSTVVVDTGEISAMDFKLGPQQKKQLFDAGYRTARDIVPMKLARGTATPPAAPSPGSVAAVG